MSIIPQRRLGSQGLVVSAQGLGCMGMTAFYGNFDRDAQEPLSLETIARALSLGINFLDTAWCYQAVGPDGRLHTNEELVGKAIKIHGRDKFVIATKFGICFQEGKMTVCGKEAFIRQQLAESLQRLGTDYIDLYYMHRMDPETPVEETMRVLAALVAEGKVRYVGLSECTPDELRRAHAVHPVTAVQMEWSLQTRDIEDSVLPAARELGVGVVAYSPLGRGFLADLDAFENLFEKDSRKNHPRFQAENLVKNKTRIEKFHRLAERRGCTPAQLALAWVHSKGEDVFPIPGTKDPLRIEENAKAFQLLPLTTAEIAEIEESVDALEGGRYPEASSHFCFNHRL